jgi:hypothetical protein
LGHRGTGWWGSGDWQSEGLHDSYSLPKLLGSQIKEDERRRLEKWGGGTDGRKILNRILKEQDGKVRSGLIWLRIGKSDGTL